MYYSEFTLKLIEEVKKREILYNTKYEKRPKAEKEEAWREIGLQLETGFERVKKHWKNIRDRFVKVMHQRDKHFASGGNELNAPTYIYFDKLIFMREFSIQKEQQIEAAPTVNISSTLSPDFLYFEEYKEQTGETVILDYTEKFLEHVRKFPELFDQNAEMRKFRSKEAWKQIADLLGGKFTVGRLRCYWMLLMKKYKLYLQNSNNHHEFIENEALFENLSFVNLDLKVKRGNDSTSDIQQFIEMENSQEYFDDLDEEEHLMCEEVEDETQVEPEVHEISINSENETGPDMKKLKLEPKINMEDFKISETVSQSVPATTPPVVTVTSLSGEDEFDYFGKKVAMQLRNVAQRNRIAARKGEIKVLELLMELEETLLD